MSGEGHRLTGAPVSDGEHELLSDPKLYQNRELSLLAFQERVLEEARDSANPLLERVKFLAIFGSNLDEFFMVRVAALQQKRDAGRGDRSIDGRTAADQLDAAAREAARLTQLARECWQQDMLPALAREGIQIVDYRELSEEERLAINESFTDKVFPVLTPLG